MKTMGTVITEKGKSRTTMQLTSENYYSLEADREYMSCSQFEDFLSCEDRR